jgi:hypothetical protein
VENNLIKWIIFQVILHKILLNVISVRAVGCIPGFANQVTVDVVLVRTVLRFITILRKS